MQIKSYKEAINYLESFIGKVIFRIDKEFLKEHDPLERMRIFLSLLGNPQEKFKSVLVGGTSGKGSTAYLISHVLTTAGYKTGFTLSPHLEKINERLQINGRQISDLDFMKMVTLMIRIIETMRKMKIGAPSYFEILVGMAFLYFAQQKVDIAIVEVGMGGEFDATNTLNPLIAVLTNVGLDHTNILGKSVSKIARTKAGIIKSFGVLSEVIPPASAPVTSVQVRAVGSPSSSATPLIVVSGVKQSSVIKIVEDRCRKIGAQLNLLRRDFGYKVKKESIKGSILDLTINSNRIQKLNDLQLSLIGKYQVENASLAIEAVLNLEKFGFEVSENAIRKALKTSFFPGRFEILRLPFDKLRVAQDKTSSTLVLDGAHNPTKMKAFLESLEKIFPKKRKVFIVGFKFDKDIPKMLRQITKVADKIIITEFNRTTDMNLHASADAFNIKNKILKTKYSGEVVVEKNSEKALFNVLAIKQSNNSTIVVVTGSLYLVGEIRNKLW